MNQNFKESYAASFKEILNLSTQPNTPYQKTIDFLNQEFDRYNLTDELRAKTMSALMANITISFTNGAMAQAMELAHKALSFEKEFEGLSEQVKNAKLKNEELEKSMPERISSVKKQNELIDAQIAKLAKEQALAKSQQEAIDRQVKDNRIIKATSVLGGFISENQAGGMIVPTGMTKMFFDMNYELVKDDITIAAPTDFTMTQKEDKK